MLLILIPPLPAVQFLDLKVWVEVEDNALRGLGGCDDPAAVLMGRIFQRVAGSGDVAGISGVKVAPAWLRCWKDRDREEEHKLYYLNLVQLTHYQFLLVSWSV